MFLYHDLINKLSFLPSVVQKAAKIDSEDAIVPRVSAEVDNVRVLLQDGNVTQMFVGIAGLGNMPSIFAVKFILRLLVFNEHISILLLHLIKKVIIQKITYNICAPIIQYFSSICSIWLFLCINLLENFQSYILTDLRNQRQTLAIIFYLFLVYINILYFSKY